MAERVRKLDEINLRKLRALEKELGCCIVALEPAPKPANLTDDQLKRLQAGEGEINTILIAYNC